MKADNLQMVNISQRTEKEDFSQLLQSGGGIPYLPYLYLSLPYLSEEV